MASLGFISFSDHSPVVVLSCGYINTCVVFQSGGIMCWGAGYTGINGRDSGNPIGDTSGTTPVNFDNIAFSSTDKAVFVSAGIDQV
jgi:hypothetical protein